MSGEQGHKNNKRRQNRAIFDDKRSLFHFFAGAISALLGIFSIIPVLIFIIYQLLEEEEKINKIGDFVEFLLGYAYGLAILCAH